MPPNSPIKRPALSYGGRLLQYSKVVAVLWLIEITDRVFFGSQLEYCGIRPRELSHLEGIIFAPFLHGNWSHLVGNSISLMILGAAILLRGWRDLIHATVASALVAGLVVFLIGAPNSVHLGASSVVFGYFGFLVGMGIYEKTPLSILFAALVVFFYGSAFSTMFPTQAARAAHLSWEAHLGGAIGGFLIVRHRRKRTSKFLK